METNAKRLKKILILAFAVNMLVIVMQTYNTASTIANARRSLVLVGNAALSSFEGGRRAMMALNPEFAPRFKQYLNSMDSGSGIRSIYLFDTDGNILLNTGNITPPITEFSGSSAVDTPEGLFVYKTIVPHSFGMGGGFGRGMGHMMEGMEKHEKQEQQESQPQILIGAALVDKASLNSVRNAELSFLFTVIVLQVLLGAVFLFTVKLIKSQNEQSRLLEMREREAQMGKMSLVMAHELKNPLSSVKGLMEYSAKKSEGAQKDIADRCVDELSRLDRIINDFLTYGRDLTIEKSDTEIHSLVSETAKLLELDASSKGVSVVISGGYTHIQADGAKMKQVLFNLILNAIQAAPEASEVRIEITPSKLTVINSYSGVVEQDKLGTPFYTTKTVGTGLGIAIVRRILDQHGFGLNLNAGKDFRAEITF